MAVNGIIDVEQGEYKIHIGGKTITAKDEKDFNEALTALSYLRNYSKVGKEGNYSDIHQNDTSNGKYYVFKT